MAASIQYDAELMTNYLPAVPVAGGTHFVACLDPATRRPIVIGLSNDNIPKLQVIKESSNGVRSTVDLGALLNISDQTPIQAFDVQQAPNLSLFMVIATAASDQKSNVLVVKNFVLTDNLSVTVRPIQQVSTVYSVYIAPPSSDSNDSKYPMVALMHQPLGRSTKGSDITRLNVTPDAWTTMRDLALPENAQEIHDIAAASSIFGKGVFVLYTIAGQRSILGEFARPLRHSTDGSLSYFSTTLTCPPGANAIESYVDQDGQSALLVGHSQGLQLFSSLDATTKDARGTLIQSAPEFQNIQRMFLAQDETVLSIWANNGSQQLVYLTSTTNTLAQGKDKPTTLLPTGSSDDFASTISKPADISGQSEICQVLISKDGAGQFTLLQQSRMTGIWKVEPFYVYNASANVEITSYTITIKVSGSNGQALNNGSVKIKASSSGSAVANGKSITIGSDPSWKSLDDTGALHLIVACDGLDGRSFEIVGVRDRQTAALPFDGVVIEPNHKAVDALGLIQTGSDLANAKTKSGKPLWEDGQKPSDSDLAQAAKCFATIHSAFKGLPANGAIVDPSVNVSTPQSRSNGAVELLMDGWHYIKKEVDHVTDWVVEKVDNVWQFVCTLAGRTVVFVLDCIEKIAEAATWIWTKIGLGIQKLIDFVGFLFSWDDILATKNTISDLLTAGIEFGGMKISTIRQSVDSFFTDLQGKVKNLQALPNNVSSTDANTTPSSGFDLQHSTPFNWTSERLKNSGPENTAIKDIGKIPRIIEALNSSDTAPAQSTTAPAQSTTAPAQSTIAPAQRTTKKGFGNLGGLIQDTIQDTVSQVNDRINETKNRLDTASTQGTTPAQDTVQKAWSDILEPVGSAFQDTASQLAKDVAALFDKNQNLSTGDLFQNIGVDLLSNVIGICKQVIGALLDILQWLLQQLSALGNYAINIPVISPLYRKISGRDLSLFDALALIIAIPTTVIIKAITNAAPPTFSGFKINGQFLSDLTSSSSTLPTSVKRDFATLVSGTVITIAVLKGTCSLIKAAVQAVKGGSGGVVANMTPSKAMSVIGLLLDFTAAISAMPSDPTLPRYDLRRAVSYATFFRVGCNMVLLLTPMAPETQEKCKKYAQVITLLNGFVNFGMMSTVYLEEIEQPTWKDKDDKLSAISQGSNGFNCLTGVGTFLLSIFAADQPEVAAVGAAVVVICSSGKVVIDGLKFGEDYKRQRDPRLLANTF